MATKFVAINETFKHEGKEYKCMKAIEYSGGEGTCKGCAFFEGYSAICYNDYSCAEHAREDEEDVIFEVIEETIQIIN